MGTHAEAYRRFKEIMAGLEKRRAEIVIEAFKKLEIERSAMLRRNLENWRKP